MTINNYHPKFIAFIKNERKTLNWLAGNTYVNSNLRELASSASQSLLSFPKKDDRLSQFNFSFHCKIDLWIENDWRTTIIESQVSNNFSLVVYSLSICEGTVSPFNLIRKFHFDYAKPIDNDPDPKPVYHLQYGGQESPGLQTLAIGADHLQPWLSSPRLHYIPTNLALFLDMIFYEFRGQATTGLVERDEWRELVKGNEETLLKPYITNLGRFIQSNHNSTYLLRDYYYGS